MRRVAFLALPLLLSGCALPPVVGAVAYLLDGASYVGTGKSMSDHALSEVAGEDCAMWRLLKGELICQGPKDKGKKNAIAIAAAKTVYPGDGPDSDSDEAPTMVAEAPQAAEPAPVATASAAPVAEKLAAIAPAAGPAPAPATAPTPWEPVLTIRTPEASPTVASRAPRSWPVAAAVLRPLAPRPLVKASPAKDAATLRAKRRLLEFRTPIEMLAEHPCPGSGSAVFCSLPAVGADG
jgi:hypothetical protein